MAIRNPKLSFVALVALVLFCAGAAHAANLKVTSFPSGAEVYVDGLFVGTTPATVSVTEGDHLVTVQITGSEWQPATTTVTIGPGSNDLSVTLLPEADITSVIAGDGLLGGGTEGDVTLSLDQDALDAVAEVVNNTFLVVETAPTGDAVNFVGTIAVVSTSGVGVGGATAGNGSGIRGSVLANTTAAPYRGMEEILNPVLAVYPWGSPLGLNPVLAQYGGGIAGEFINETGGQIMSGKVGPSGSSTEVWAVQGDGSIHTSGDLFMSGSLFLHDNGGGSNTALGSDALASDTSGFRNTAVGFRAMQYNLDGQDNTAFGAYALQYNVSGYKNVAVGGNALIGATGNYNIALGYGAGRDVTSGGYNIHIGSPGQSSDNGVIRIGSGQPAAYISGIYGVDLPSALQVVIDSNGQLGTAGAAPSFEGTNTGLGLNTLSSGSSGAGNTAIGYFAASYVYGDQNTAVGYYALGSTTSGYRNVAIGSHALFGNTTGSFNTAIGDHALQSQSDASYNTGVGAYALYMNTTGYRNAALGKDALRFNDTGESNTAVGFQALNSNSNGYANTAVGDSAMWNNTSGTLNTVVGVSALNSNTTGSANAAIGFLALLRNEGGSHNVALGRNAASNVVSGVGNVALGNYAFAGGTGNRNISIGYQAGSVNQFGDDNIFLGSQGDTYDSETIRLGEVGLHSTTYLAGVHGVNIPGGSPVVIDSNGQLGVGGNSYYQNTAVGYGALTSNSTGSFNTAFGNGALTSNYDGNSNTAIGTFSLSTNSTGFNNTATGGGALASNTVGSFNSAFGAGAMDSADGYHNSGFGAGALSQSTGYGNVALGSHSMVGLTVGNQNIAVGYQSGSGLQSGSYNIFIGNYGEASDYATIRIGAIGAQSQTFIAGINGVSVGGAAVEIDGQGQLGTTISSRRFKEEVEEMADASAGLWALRPVTFQYKKEVLGDRDATLEFGLIAEEVAEIFPNLVIYDEEGRPKSVRYRLLSTLLLNELQKQHDLLTRQREALAVQEDELERVNHRLDLLERLSASQAASNPDPSAEAPRAGAP